MAFDANGTLWTTGSGATTPATTVSQQGQVTAFGDTTPLFVIKNNAAAGGVSIWPRYLRLMNTATAPTGTIDLFLAVLIDSTSKLPTAANQYSNPLISNMDTRDTSSATVATLYHYAVAAAFATPASSASVKVVYRASIPTGVAVLHDTYTFQFNMQDQPMTQKQGLTAARATDSAGLSAQGAGFSIAPGLWATFHLWWVTSGVNLPIWETELCWYELA